MQRITCELWRWPMEPGTWADWVTAGVAFGAFVAASIAAVSSWKQNQNTLALLRLERQRDDNRLATEARSYQADRVAVWTSGFRAQVNNQSLLPIYDVVISFYLDGDGPYDVADHSLGVLPPA